VRGQFRPPQDPRKLLEHAIRLMQPYLDQLTPQERARLAYVAQLLQQGGSPTREQVMALQQDYLRLKTYQEAALGQVEENVFHLWGAEVEAAQTARVQLDGGNLLTREQMAALAHARGRVALPTIFAQLEAHAPLLSDIENQELTRARIMYDMQGQLDPKTLQDVHKLQQTVIARQHLY